MLWNEDNTIQITDTKNSWESSKNIFEMNDFMAFMQRIVIIIQIKNF